MFLISSVGKQNVSMKSYAKHFKESFETIKIFPLINLVVTSISTFFLMAIDFMLSHSF